MADIANVIQKPPKKNSKKKPPIKATKSEQNNNENRTRSNIDNKEDMLANYQPWVIQTYGDLAKTKTITLKKYARILRTLRGEEIVSADNSKFRFWVKAKGFCVGQPVGYDPKPADGIVGRFSVCDMDDGIPPTNEKLAGSAKDPPLYVPNAPFKNSTGEPVYRKVAVVENFFDIIYNVHVDLEGRPGKHAGQKRTYRTITETYAFLPREAVTRFLLGCTECQKHPRSPSPTSLLPTPSPSPTLPPAVATLQQMGPAAGNTPTVPQVATPVINNSVQQGEDSYYGVKNGAIPPRTTTPPMEHTSVASIENTLTPTKNATAILNPALDPPKRSSNPLDVCNLTSKDPPRSPAKRSHADSTPKLWSPVDNLDYEEPKKKKLMLSSNDIDYSLPITTTYLKYMRSLGCRDEDAFKFDNKHENLPTPESSEGNEDDHYGGNRNGNSDIPDLSSVPGSEDMVGLWAQYHSALGLAKGKATPPTTRDNSSPVNAETGSAHDETSSSGNKEDEDDDDDESDDKIDAQTHDPERLKAFNMFVRLFVDENLDRMVPISKQPKEKIQAIIDSCTRQFPEFAERARKRIRTYLKSCRRNKRARDPNSPWDATRPTPAHLTSVQAEQILATACENESHNAKRMRLGLEPVSQPMPVLPGTQPTDSTAPINRGLDFSSSSTPVKMENDVISTGFSAASTPSSTPNSSTKVLPSTPETKTSSLSVTNAGVLGPIGMNGLGISSTASAAPTAMYRPNFTQAFQRTGPYPLFPGSTPFAASGGLLTNGPADLSMKQKPILNHKLSAGEMTAVRQLITGYRESAAFLLRSADELEQLLIQQQ
ncbi:nucleolar protein 4 isoform X2 [Diabrotica undecimpunctata]|uniref:nucleolar protein 4 isoform X2 n=1 Tax=Diabrotica undecimpunctata TaxID=50387 RepID=UPI003B63D9BC